MNAICGILSHNDADAPLAAVSAGLHDYGTEGGEWRGKGIGLGFRSRPGAAGGQALRFDMEAGLACVADVRLDDRETLCAALGVPQPDRAALADGDLILRAYLRWGAACPTHLLGDYAFAVWNAWTRTLFCARDHVGARPFYYATLAEGFVFASAVEAVLAAPGVSDALDEATVAASLTRIGLTTPTRTFFQAVRKLPPGHTLTVDFGSRGGARLQRYWRPEHTPRARPASDDAYAAELLDLYAKAVRARLRGPDPIGAHLSGGLDSSSIVVLAARELRRQGRPLPLAFSWLPALGAAPPSADDRPEYARIDAVAAREQVPVFHRSPNVSDMVALLSRDGTYPGVHVHLNEDVVQRCAAQQGVRVLLSGWGGDEGISFNGRGYDAHLLLSGRWHTLLAASRARDNPLLSRDGTYPGVHVHLNEDVVQRCAAQQGVRVLLSGWGGDEGISFNGRGYDAHLLLSGRWHTLLAASRARDNPLHRLLAGVVLRLIHPRLPGTLRRWLRGAEPLHRRWLVDPAFARRTQPLPQPAPRFVGVRRTQLSLLQHGHLQERIEGWAASGARRGLEYRYPLLDRRVLEFALGLPAEQFRRGKWTRWVMRHALRSVLPPDICWHPGKEDPARLEPLLDAFAGALPVVRRMLEERVEPPARAGYIDMLRLCERLDADRFRANPQLAPICNALQFLDFS